MAKIRTAMSSFFIRHKQAWQAMKLSGSASHMLQSVTPEKIQKNPPKTNELSAESKSYYYTKKLTKY